MITRSTSPRHLMLFAFIILSWGLAWPINKLGLNDLSPSWFTAARLFIGAIAMFGMVIATKKFCVPKREDWLLISVLGLLQISVYILLTNYGLKFIPAGQAALLAYTTPIWVLPISIFFFKEKVSSGTYVGGLLGLIGIVLLVDPWTLNWNQDTFFGTLLLLAAALCWAISILCARYMNWRKSPLEFMPWQLALGFLPILAWALYHEPHPEIHLTTSLLVSLLYTGVLVTGFSYWAGVVVCKELPSSVVSLGFLAAPAFSLIVSTLYMGETLTMQSSIAIGLIFLGLVLLK